MRGHMSKNWDSEQRRLYKRVRQFISNVAQPAFCHPEAPPIAPEHWETIAHNAAWTAADELRSTASVVVTEDVGGRVIDETKVD